ncbi:MAG: GAF domain-containing protein [Candidatus Coatesbacteria bacterium]|nr:MAG: GAF domain-containing protein [Candidatus Coatesbacteria bacterium]
MAEKTEMYERLMTNVKGIAGRPSSQEEKLQAICDLLKSAVPYFDWVGFYITDPENPEDLVLGPYNGAPTEHVRISLGTGICGRAALTRRMFVVQDVSQETNYLACSPEVKAEIVLPIFLGGQVWGELDIDSHTLAPFTSEDGDYLGRVCLVVADIVRQS